MSNYETVIFTPEFLHTFADKVFSHAERQRFLRALDVLGENDENEKHPSLRVHRLQGNLQGQWSASASDVLCITFERVEDGKKRLVACSRHYQ